jgi:Predicted transcriptional regulator
VPNRKRDYDPKQLDALSRLLRRLRTEAGLSANSASKLARGVSQSGLSRYERGLIVPSVEQATELARVYGASPADRAELLRMVRDLRERTSVPAKVILRRGGLQERIKRIENGSIHLRTFQPLLIPGLLQTPAYQRAVFASGGDMTPDAQAAEVAARTERQTIVGDGQHQVTVVVPEAALRWQLGGPEVMVEQLRHLIDRSRLPGVRVGVIPWRSAVDLAPTHGFDLFDERAVLVGIETAATFLTNPVDVAVFVKQFGQLEALAVFDDEARQVIAAVLDDLQIG